MVLWMCCLFNSSEDLGIEFCIIQHSCSLRTNAFGSDLYNAIDMEYVF
jgi:hypothetical protein